MLASSGSAAIIAAASCFGVRARWFMRVRVVRSGGSGKGRVVGGDPPSLRSGGGAGGVWRKWWVDDPPYLLGRGVYWSINANVQGRWKGL